MIVVLAIVSVYSAVAVALVLWMRQNDPAWGRLYNPVAVLVGTSAAYSFVPLLAPNVLQENSDTLERFLLIQLVALSGIAIGAVAVGRLVRLRDETLAAEVTRDGGVIQSAAVLFLLMLWLGTLQLYEGGVTRILSEGYFSGQVVSAQDTLVIGLVTYSCIAAILTSTYARGFSRFNGAVIALFCALNLLAGHRNVFIMLAGGLASVHSLRSGRPRYSLLVAGVLTGYFVLTVVGVYRNFGFSGLGAALELFRVEGRGIFNPSSQELGTSYNVFRTYSHLAVDPFRDWLPGESYYRAILSVVPRAIWEGRPDAISTVFSNGSAELGEGLGFSINLEAFISLGWLGVATVNALLASLLYGIYRSKVARMPTAFGLAVYWNLVFIAFNTNRIDAQTVFKLSLLLVGFAFIFLRWIVRVQHAASVASSA